MKKETRIIISLLIALIALSIANLFFNGMIRTDTQAILKTVSPDQRSLTYEERLETCRMNIIGINAKVKTFQDNNDGNYPDDINSIIKDKICPVDGLSYEDMIMTTPLGSGNYIDKTQHKH